MSKMVSLNTKTVHQKDLKGSVEVIDKKKDEESFEENKVETFSIVALSIIVMGIFIILLS
ncbi:hypothetical protein D4Z93_04520 [Clostridium fermenticellae]|uniref:Uncharacterized protein n=1 Tax=Clostridium fermenticellae TaxID=2068654 RepID=A0A386H2B7_9CLOT|nr:hypothetical protein [Clostridium fermenticellae]AYD39820.1 hypothetical protein D4Z93_04520 [Clostridium fermenticellae]